jgi:hypothetical protein
VIGCGMPTVATLDGTKIQLYWDDHPPPHFHAEYGEYRAGIAIDTLMVINGYIPVPQFRKGGAWAKSRRGQLLDAWWPLIEWINERGEEIDFGADSLRAKAENQARLNEVASILQY